MFLYHGSNVSVEKPKIITPNRALDFGAGFYVTSSEDQAIKWAKLQANRRSFGVPTVSMYEFDMNILNKLNVKTFDSADEEWLAFVVSNRKGIYSGPKFDVVIGPVANDTTITVLNSYIAGQITEKIALLMLEPQKLVDQFAFLTYDALNNLNFKGVAIHE